MGGFWNTLGQVGQGLAQGIAKKSPLGQAVYGGVQNYMDKKSQPPTVGLDDMESLGITAPNTPTAGAYARYNSPSTPGVATPVNPQVTGDVGAPAQSPYAPPAVTPLSVTQQPGDETGSQIGNQSQWNQPSGSGQSPVGNVIQAGLTKALGLKGGAIITQPTLARIGEHGPEAVVPLTPRAGNKLQPDLLEGHITPAKVPGVRYSRYRSYSRM
jgi:hypothetical protein